MENAIFLLTMAHSLGMLVGSLTPGLAMDFMNLSSTFPMAAIFLIITLFLMITCFRMGKK